jgi:hypothetical protein
MFQLINSYFNMLITELSTDMENGQVMIERQTTSHDDLYNAF